MYRTHTHTTQFLKRVKDDGSIIQQTQKKHRETSNKINTANYILKIDLSDTGFSVFLIKNPLSLSLLL